METYKVLNVFKHYTITQEFGWTPFALKMKVRYEETGKQLYRYGIHTGIDLSMKIGTEVLCPLTGIVVVDDDSNNSGRGIAASIWDPDQLLAFRAYHLKRNIVKENYYIKAGNAIGLSGKSAGKLTIGNEPHLHWELVRTDETGRAIGLYNGAMDPYGKNIIWLDMTA